MRSVSRIQKKHIMVAFLFMICMTEYMISLICMDKSSYVLADKGELLHYLKMPALGIGILLFPLSQRLGSSIKVRRVIMLVSNIIFVAGMTCVMEVFFQTGMVLHIVSFFISLLSLGFLCGAVYYFFAVAFTAHPYMGRVSGIAGSVAFCIQILVLYAVSANLVMLLLLIVGFAATTYVTIFSAKRFEWMFDEPLEYARKDDPSLPDVRTIAAGIAAMAMVYMICGITDSMIVSMNFAGDMSVYAWPRLFGAVGYLAGGFVADLGRRKWVLNSALCLSILSIPLPFLLSEGHTLTGTCLYYIVAVAQIEFLNVFFWELAVKTSHPQLVSGMSRVLCCVCAVFLPFFAHLSVMAALTIEVLLAVSVAVCITAGNHFQQYHLKAGKNEAVRPDNDLQSVENSTLDRFAKRHGLTPREKELLTPLIESDDEIQTIAASMNISTRTVYRHINSIYEKTGTETRYALMRLYYETK